MSFTECHYAQCHFDECRYAECHFAECRGTIFKHFFKKKKKFVSKVGKNQKVAVEVPAE
jgi:hypothetical protein